MSYGFDPNSTPTFATARAARQAHRDAAKAAGVSIRDFANPESPQESFEALNAARWAHRKAVGDSKLCGGANPPSTACLPKSKRAIKTDAQRMAKVRQRVRKAAKDNTAKYKVVPRLARVSDENTLLPLMVTWVEDLTLKVNNLLLDALIQRRRDIFSQLREVEASISKITGGN